MVASGCAGLRCSGGAARLQVEGGHLAQAGEREQAHVDEGDVAPAVQAQRPAQACRAGEAMPHMELTVMAPQQHSLRGVHERACGMSQGVQLQQQQQQEDSRNRVDPMADMPEGAC